jgi:hypothetical protein
MSPRIAHAIEVLRAEGGSILDVRTALVIVLPRVHVAGEDGTALLPLAEAARIAATSVRVLRDAIRARELPAVGRQRDRAVRRPDLEKWIASRAVRPVEGPSDADLDRRVAQLAKNRVKRRLGET